MAAGAGHGQVSGQQVEQRGDVGGALDAGVATQCHDSAARAPHVSQQQLQNGGSPDELRSQGVLGPANGVGEARCPVTSGVFRDGTRQVLEVRDGDAAHLLDHLRRVPGVMPLHDLENGPGVLQGFVTLHFSVLQGRTTAAELVAGGTARSIGRRVPNRAGLVDGAAVLFCVGPRRGVIGARFRIESGEQPAQVLGVTVIVMDQRGRIGVRADVLLEPEVMGDDVVDQGTQEHNVRARPDGNVLVRDRRRTREPGVDVDDLRSAGLGLRHPLVSHGMALGHVGTLDDDAVGVGHVLQ